MSEEILKALMQLFGIITKQDGGVTEKERSYVEQFLIQQISLDLVPEYLALYEKHADWGKERKAGDEKKLTSVKDSVRTLAICKKINKTLSQKQKVIVVIRLFELLKSDNNFTEQRVAIIDTASEVFNIEKKVHELIEVFITKDKIEDLASKDILLVTKNQQIEDRPEAKHIHSHDLDGYIAILHIQNVDMYFLKYEGNDEIELSSLLVGSGTIYLFAHGSIIKVAKSEPIFYSDVISKFLDDFDIPQISFNVENLHFKFPNGDLGLRNINISEGPGKLLGIMGASGAGKTTLLNTLAGLTPPSEGSIKINGNDIFKEKEKIEGVIGYIAQDDILVEELTVYENLYFAAKLSLNNLEESVIQKRVLKVLDQLGLLERKDLKVGSVLDKTISGGQRKRLNIALELIREPDVLFVDEPTSGLSSRDSENVMDLLKELTLKGKLIFVVIHQPSSDIYKMFDKMIILDTGGYQIFYGNPVEAVIYFKTATNQLNSERGQCVECGNVNPEQIFNIIEAKVVDEYGNFTDKRKTSPIQWGERYQANIINPKVDDSEEKLPKNLFIPSKLKQWFLFTKRDLMSKISNKQYVTINLLEAPILAAILAIIVRYITDLEAGVYVFRENENLPAYIFMSIIVAFFMGLTVSAEEIIKDRKLLKREKLLNLSKMSYLLSKILILFTLSGIQTICFTLVGNLILGVEGMTLNYWIIFFSISCYANILGLNISATFNSVITVYILIPLLIIPQMILSGAIFDFDKLNNIISSKERVPIVADVMASRWAFEALTVSQFRDNFFESHFYDFEQKESYSSYKNVYYIPKLKKILQKSSDLVLKEAHPSEDDKKLVAHYVEVIKNEIIKEGYETPSISNKSILEKIDGGLTPELYTKIERYLDNVQVFYQNTFNKINALKDEKLSSYNAETFNQIKDKYYNDFVADAVMNVDSKDKVIIYQDHLVQKIDPIFEIPKPKNAIDYRAHFYAPQKHFLGSYYNTFWFNVLVIWIGCIILFVTLYFETFKWLLEIGEKVNFFKKNN